MEKAPTIIHIGVMDPWRRVIYTCERRRRRRAGKWRVNSPAWSHETISKQDGSGNDAIFKE
ncbi:hypothetical protein V1478_001492 [Vespula squamosa]|uniref:Uncharacterized protein n=1 Tax=Vespula squamosa TaxID=30214 RepID=A0ABD2C1L5_VESSQ